MQCCNALCCPLLQRQGMRWSTAAAHHEAVVTSADTGGMLLDVRLETAGAATALALAGAFEGDPLQTGALTFSLDALVGDPPARQTNIFSFLFC